MLSVKQYKSHVASTVLNSFLDTLCRVLKDQLMSTAPGNSRVQEYVSQFRERLHDACTLAKEPLSPTQKKRHFDHKAVPRSLQLGDSVLVLLPIPGSSLSARFSSPYLIEKRLSDTDYIVQTPDRKCALRVCHINMLKRYHGREVITPSTDQMAWARCLICSLCCVGTCSKPG